MSSDPRAGSFQRASDGRSWNEYHGVGHPCDWQGEGHNHPVGGIHFDDDTERGQHSHAVHANGSVTWHRHEGSDSYCYDDDCDEDNYGRYGRGYGRPDSWRAKYGY